MLRDPWQNEFCVLQVDFPELLERLIMPHYGLPMSL